MAAAGELEIDEDLDFQRREWRWQRAGRLALGLFVVAAAAGVFGRGPVSRATAGEPQSALSVDYERFVRQGADMRISVHLGASAPSSGPRELRIGRSLFDGTRIERIQPPPVETIVAADAVVLRFAAAPGGAGSFTVHFDAQPLVLGRHEVSIAAGGHVRTLAFFAFF